MLGDESVKKLIVALIGVAIFGFGQTALADEYAVSYSENELTNVVGVESVHARIVKVAKQYCPTYSQIRNHKEVSACVSDVVVDLVNKVDHPRLSGYHVGDESVRVADAGSRQEDRS
jgi:UrcA family protein